MHKNISVFENNIQIIKNYNNFFYDKKCVTCTRYKKEFSQKEQKQFFLYRFTPLSTIVLLMLGTLNLST